MNTTIFSTTYNISLWAKHHPIAARWLIAFSRIIMAYIIFYWGVLLADNGLVFFKTLFVASAVSFLIGYFLYPKKTTGFIKQLFIRKKICDGILIFSSCFFWLASSNYILQWSPNSVSAEEKIIIYKSAIAKEQPSIWTGVEKAKIVKKVKEKRKGFFKKIKTWRKQFFQKTKNRIKKNLALIKYAVKELDGGTTALLVLGTLLIVVVLGYATLAWSCSLSCNGQEGAATMVLIFGIGAIAAIIALMWTSALRKQKRKESNT